MDRIIVRTIADMQRVIDWAEVLTGMAVELPFPEGEIEFQEEELLLKFADEGAPMVSFEMWTHGTKVVSWRSDLSSGEIPELHIAAEGTRKVEPAMLLASDNTVAKCVRKFRSLMLFAAYYREDIARTKTVERRDTGVKVRKNGKRSNRRPLTIRKYTIGAEMLGELPAPKKEWHGYRESFGVRGHYRRYKSGKVVWVRPYEKKGRDDKRGDREFIL